VSNVATFDTRISMHDMPLRVRSGSVFKREVEDGVPIARTAHRFDLHGETRRA
jgi:hypothetical protein